MVMSDAIYDKNMKITKYVSTSIALTLLCLPLLLLNGCPKDNTPPGNAAGFTATAGDAKIMLAWTNPSDSDFAGIRIQRKQGSAPTSVSDGNTIYDGGGTSFVDTGLTNGNHYYYTAYTYDGTPNYASGVSADAVPTIATASRDVTMLFEETAGSIAGAPGNTLPAEQASALGDKLALAEADYRGGDICGAAAALREYEALAQQFRGEASGLIVQGGLENLYNLGRSIRFDMIAGSSAKDLCPGEERVGEEAAADPDETHSDNTEMQAMASFGEPRLHTAIEDGETFTQVEVPGANAESGEPGEPAIPVYRRFVGVPQGADVSIEASVENAETIQMNLFPYQEHGIAAAPGSPPPQYLVDDRPPFTKNDASYQQDALFPPSPAQLVPAGQFRDLRLYELEVPAGQYNPKTQALTLFKHVNVKVTFSGETNTGSFVTEATVSPFETASAHIYSSVLNKRAISKFRSPVGRYINWGEEFMILTHPKFLDAANKLADWKNKKGISTRVYIVNDGDGPAPDTAEDIDKFIENHFNTAKIRPSYLLLIGDAEYIPTFYLTSNLDPSATIASDWPYSNIPAAFFDIFPDLGTGRIPVDTLAEANTYVDKVINYEKTPPLNRAFYQNATVASQFQCCRKDTDYAHRGSDQSLFIWPCEVARNAMVAKGYNVQRIYGETVDGGDPSAHPPVPAYTGDTTPRYYWDGTAIPGDLGPGSGFAWNGTADDVVDAWNEGRFLIIHVDHGFPGGWGTPAFNWNHVYYDLSNDLLPVLFSINCSSGYYDNEIVGDPKDYNQVYFTEMLIRYPGRAVGVISSTRTSWIWPNAYHVNGFVDAVFPNTVPSFGDNTSYHRLGDILIHGGLYMLTQINLTVDAAHAGDQIHMYHVFGDPTLEMWTSYPYKIHLGWPVSISSIAGSLRAQFGVEGATITVFRPDPNMGPPIPVARGVVQDGVAPLDAIAGLEFGQDLQVSVSLPDSVSETTTSVLADASDVSAPGPVTEFTVRATPILYSLSWTNPGDADFAGVRVQRKVGSYPTSPTDGDTVYDGSGEFVVDTPDATPLPNYYYTAFAHDGVPNYATGVHGVRYSK